MVVTKEQLIQAWKDRILNESAKDDLISWLLGENEDLKEKEANWMSQVPKEYNPKVKQRGYTKVSDKIYTTKS